MSAYLMGRIMRETECTPIEYLLLVALADHAHDDGSEVFPTVEYLCWKTRLSERLVRKKLKLWREVQVLIPLCGEGGGRGHTVEYQLNVDSLPSKEPFAGKPSGAARAARRTRATRGKGALSAPFRP